MSKSTYIIVSGFLSLGFLSNFLSQNILFILFMFWTVGGFCFYSGYSDLYTNKNRSIVFLFLVLFFFSALTPIFRYNQDIIATAVAMRGNLVVLFLLVLFKIKPEEEDFYKAFHFLAIVALVLSVFVYVFPQFFVSEERIRSLLIRQSRGSTDIIVSWPGSAAVVFYFYMTLGRMIERSQNKDFLWCTICLTYIFVMQNRSTLLGTVPFYLYGLLKTDIKYKNLIIFLIVITTGGFIYNIASSLIEESTTQLNDEKYNRWQAVSFFLFEQKNNIYTILFGHGVPCAGSAYLAYLFDAQNTRYAIASDIGMFGSYFFYGISVLGIIYYYIFNGIIRKDIPLYVKFYSLWILFVPTIHSFAQGVALGGTFKLLLIIYLIVYYSKRSQRIVYMRNIV